MPVHMASWRDLSMSRSAGRGDLADGEHAAGIAVPAVLDDGDVDVDDVALLEALVRARDAVADHVIDRGADRLREAAVIQGGRNGLLHVHDELVAAGIELVGGDAGYDVRADHVQHVRGQAAGDAHLFLLGGVLIVTCMALWGGSQGSRALFDAGDLTVE